MLSLVALLTLVKQLSKLLSERYKLMHNTYNDCNHDQTNGCAIAHITYELLHGRMMR
jgi:hypothetical protein